MLLSAVSVLVVAQSSSEIPEGLMNNPVLSRIVHPVGLICETVGIPLLRSPAVSTYPCQIPQFTWRQKSPPPKKRKAQYFQNFEPYDSPAADNFCVIQKLTNTCCSNDFLHVSF